MRRTTIAGLLVGLAGCNALLDNPEGELVAGTGGAATGGSGGGATGGAGGSTGGAGGASGGTAGAGGSTGGAGGSAGCAVEIDVGDHHACARMTDGTLWCWGLNQNGQVGDGTTAPRQAPVKVDTLGTGAAEAGTGGYHTCARKTDGTLWCWGLNDFGQLGDGPKVSQPKPTQVKALGSDVANVALGAMHSCARKTDGTVWCWGLNDFGQLGDGTMANASVPQPVKALGAVASVSAGGAHSCARKTDGTGWCWGRNESGQLGDGTTVNSSGPVKVAALGTDTYEVAAGGEHTCVRKTDNTLWCWGANTFGQLGNGSSSGSPAPVAVSELGTAVSAVALGSTHSCARKADWTLWCWGENSSGQLGINSYDKKPSPVQVNGLGNAVVEVAVGSYANTCARKSDGSVWCWGMGNALGDGTSGAEACNSQMCTPSPVKTALCP